MSVPNIKPPPGTPRFQIEGHSIDEDSVYAQIGYAQGHSRSRRRWTSTQRVVTVSWFLSAQRLLAIDDWFENALKSGEREFAAEVKNEGAGTLWWTARWISYQTEMKPGNRGRVTGSILLTGTPQETAPAGIDLGMSIGAALLDIRSSIFLPADMSMSVGVPLSQPLPMALSITAALLSIDGTAATETIILRDEFSGSGDLLDHTPDVELGDATPWTYENGPITLTGAGSGGGGVALEVGIVFSEVATKFSLGTFSARTGPSIMEFQFSLTDAGDGGGGIEVDWAPTGSPSFACYVWVFAERVGGVTTVGFEVNGVSSTVDATYDFENLPIRMEFEDGLQRMFIDGVLVTEVTLTETLLPFERLSDEGPQFFMYGSGNMHGSGSPDLSQTTIFERVEVKTTDA